MKPLKVYYEDNHIIVVEKPCNVLSQADATGDIDLLSMVKEYIKEQYHKPGNVYVGLVHRLDRPVGGVMVFARTSKAASRLSESIRKDQWQKTYLAVVDGILESKKAILEDYLGKDDNGNAFVTDRAHGKLARLSYEVLQEDLKMKKTLVKIALESGRHHQIRIQFASRNHPLCGDQRYGKKDGRQICLHCHQLSFIHPVKKERMTFTSYPDPKDDWTLFTL